MSDESGYWSLVFLLRREIAWYERLLRIRLFEQGDCRILDGRREKEEGREGEEIPICA